MAVEHEEELVAYIEIRVSGRPKAGTSEATKPKRRRKVFRNNREDISDKNAFVAGMVDVETKYDVRYKVNDRLVSDTFDTKREAERTAEEAPKLDQAAKVAAQASADAHRKAQSLEGIVADDLWPLPKYSEMLFIK